jgi:aerobic carbon-monoxide dehydrogenase small subunit
MTEPMRIAFHLNGEPVEVWARPSQTVLEVLRDVVGASEVKYGCGEGVCGTCTVLLDGASVNACLLFAPQVAGCHILTLRGLEIDGQLSGIQAAFLANGGSQCGFCTPGMILVAHEFLQERPGADREEIRTALAGNLCRCTGYTKILDAVLDHVSGATPAKEGL